MAIEKESNFTELMSLMFTIGRFMREPKRGNSAEGQMSLLQFETLRFIKEHGEPHMREVASHFRVTPPAATLLIDGLVRDKLLSRVFDKNDRRAVHVALTALGKNLLSRGMKEKMKKLQAMHSSLTAEEQKQLVAILKKMSKNSESKIDKK